MSRTAVRLLLPLVAVGLALSACGDDEPVGDGGITLTGEPETTAPATGGTTSPPLTVVTTTLDQAGRDVCDELAAISEELVAAFPDGVGIDADAVLEPTQVDAVRALGERYAAVDVPDEGIAEVRDQVVAAAAEVVAVGEAEEPLPAEVAGGLTSSLTQLGALCTVGQPPQ